MNTPIQTPEKKSITMDLNRISFFLDDLQMYASRFYNFFKDNKNNSKLMLIIALITSGLAIYFGIQLYNDVSALNGKTAELTNLSSYDTRTLESNTITQAILKNADTIQDLLQENKSIKGEIAKYTDYLYSLQVPYTYLLKYIYLPSLNVRKENYTDTIDINLI